jgi:hypothetical protein
LEECLAAAVDEGQMPEAISSARRFGAMRFRWSELCSGVMKPAAVGARTCFRACANRVGYSCNQSAFWQNNFEFSNKNNDGENRGGVS